MVFSRRSTDRRARSAAPPRSATSPVNSAAIRAGLHTGEIELIGDDIGGIAAQTAARVAAKAEADEVWTSRTVKDLVAGSGLEFSERGPST